MTLGHEHVHGNVQCSSAVEGHAFFALLIVGPPVNIEYQTLASPAMQCPSPVWTHHLYASIVQMDPIQ